ncbi:MAG: DUF3604 domain-containing protein [Pseudomonadales bacterium]
MKNYLLGCYLVMLTALAFDTQALTNELTVAAGSAIAAEASDELVTSKSMERSYSITEQRQPCREYTELKRPYFGDTHVHTGLSQDASTQGTRMRPVDAYRFAKGEKVELQPYGEDGRGARAQQISRPLDFSAITDHAELYGEVRICNTPELEGYNSWVCKVYQNFPRVAFYLMNARMSFVDGRWAFCGEGGQHCEQQAAVVWEETQQAAEQAYDRSDACEFTSFNAYEWTGLNGPTGKGNMHRNVIFRNENVPPSPISAMDGRQTDHLWGALEEQCLDADTNCDVLVIPHNSNMSGGNMLSTLDYAGDPIDEKLASQRARLEPLIEVMQHKGSSECFFGSYGDVAADELCAFEFLSESNISNPRAGAPGPGNGYIREALRDGLRVEDRVGVNPFKFGFVASTDTHLAIPGAVEEDLFQGGGGAGKPARDAVPPGLPDNPEYNPGGLAVIWAEENTRDALFNAMRNKETYGTSGTRIELRFFGGWDYSDSLCDSTDLVAEGYKGGVPMGGDLPERTVTTSNSSGPRFAIAAKRDSEYGEPLQRVQVIKGWLAEDGSSQEKVFEVAGSVDNGATVNLETCETSGNGRANLCTVWQDPEFDPKQSSYYYTRALENPSCRWSQRICNANQVDCSVPETMGEGLEACCKSTHRPSIQERAWSSPIWYRAQPLQ